MTKIRVNGGPYEQMRATIALVGDAIRKGAHHLPIRNLAAGLATTAGPKDYLGQAKAIFDYATKLKWRYVKDPVDRELITTNPDALFRYVLAGDGIGLGAGRGGGDCDDIATGVGALLYSIGHPVRLATTAPRGSPAGNMFGHIFVQTSIPKVGWVTVDPVVYPQKGFAATPDHSRIAFYDLKGNVIGKKGNAVGLHGLQEEIKMRQDMDPGMMVSGLPDYGLSGIDTATPDDLPEDWRLYGIPDFGAYSEQYGIISGDEIEPLAAEISYELEGNRLLARTPILELAKKDFNYLKRHRKPYHGMMALGDDLTTYAFDGNLGFFKKLFRRIKKGVKKVARRIGRGMKKIIRKIPGGKKLIRLGSKIWKIAHKIVKPLTKFVGKYAAKLAPIAALIPGYGPAIAGALYSAGKIANVMNKYGVKLFGKKGQVRKLKFPSATIATKFRQDLEKEAAKARRARSRSMRRRAKVSRRRTPSAVYGRRPQNVWPVRAR